MRRLTIFVAILAALYSGYWFIGVYAAERGATSGIDVLRSDDWTIDYTDLNTAGFPSRFDTTISDLHLRTPDDALEWSTPFVQALSLSYQPNHVILALPPEQVLRVGHDTMTINADGLRASTAVSVSTDLPLENLTAEAAKTTITSDRGWSLMFDSALFALRRNTPDGNDYDAFISAEALQLPLNLRQLLDPNGNNPQQFGDLSADAKLTLDRTLDRTTAERWRQVTPRLLAIDLRKIDLNWGGMRATAQGQLQIDGAGVPTGKISISLAHWADMLQLAIDAGLVDATAADTWRSMASGLAGGSDTLDLPITFSGGMMSMGFIPLGPAPRF